MSSAYGMFVIFSDFSAAFEEQKGVLKKKKKIASHLCKDTLILAYTQN